MYHYFGDCVGQQKTLNPDHANRNCQMYCFGHFDRFCLTEDR